MVEWLSGCVERLAAMNCGRPRQEKKRSEQKKQPHQERKKAKSEKESLDRRRMSEQGWATNGKISRKQFKKEKPRNERK